MAIVWDDDSPTSPSSTIVWDDESHPDLSSRFQDLPFLQKLGFPSQVLHATVGKQVENTVGGVKNMFEATPIGALVKATIPPVLESTPLGATILARTGVPLTKTLYEMQPQLAGSLAAEAVNPLNWLGVKGFETGLENIQKPLQELSLGRPSTIQNPNVPRDLMFTRIRNRLLNAPRIASREFESGLQDLQVANPGTTINAQEELVRANTFQAQNAHFNSILENSLRQAPISETQRGIVRSLLDHPESATNLSLEQAQALKQVFKQSLKQKFDQVSPEYVGAHLDMLDLWHSLRVRELEAFPQLQGVLRGYRNVLGSFRLVANALKEGNIESALLGDFNNRGLLIKAFNQLATPDTLKLVGRLQSATHLQDLFQKLGIAGALGTAGAVGAGVAGRPIIRFLTGQ